MRRKRKSQPVQDWPIHAVQLLTALVELLRALLQ